MKKVKGKFEFEEGEKEWFLENYFVVGRKKCAERMGIHVNVAYKLARKLGLPNNVRVLTEEEKAWVKENYSKMYDKDMCKELGIGSKMLKKVVKELNLHDEPVFESLLGEEWRNVKGFEGYYKISNKGRLLSNKYGKWHIMSNINKKGGYLGIILRHPNGTRKSTRIHRLVYETFIGEIPQGKRHHIHHKDGNKQNNIVENLEFLDASSHFEQHYGKHYQIPRKNGGRSLKQIEAGVKNLQKRAKTKEGHPAIVGRRVSQYTLDGEFVAEYLSCSDASKKTGVCARNIHQVASKTPFNDKGNIRKQAGGYIWQFAE